MKEETVLVLMGGISTEREVSLNSGKSVSAALRRRGYRVEELDLTRETLPRLLNTRADAVFIALHGLGGEDGSVQGILDWMGVPYTGPGVAASALCMDKITTKCVLCREGIPTPSFEIIASEDPRVAAGEAERAAERLGLPLVLKASRQGSSIGTVILPTREEIVPAVRELLSYGDRILAEEFLSGTELTVPILGSSELTVLPVIEIVSQGEFYDYKSKYEKGGSRHVIPARISPETEERVRAIATAAYRATGCRGHARVDVMLSASGEPFVIEINTSPGMTSTSLFPDAARAAGISFEELVGKLVELAKEKA